MFLMVTELAIRVAIVFGTRAATRLATIDAERRRQHRNRIIVPIRLGEESTCYLLGYVLFYIGYMLRR